jgi:hypothetical protein
VFCGGIEREVLKLITTLIVSFIPDQYMGEILSWVVIEAGGARKLSSIGGASVGKTILIGRSYGQTHTACGSSSFLELIRVFYMTTTMLACPRDYQWQVLDFVMYSNFTPSLNNNHDDFPRIPHFRI